MILKQIVRLCRHIDGCEVRKGLHSGQDAKQKLNINNNDQHSWRNCTLAFVSTAYWRKMVTINEPKKLINIYLNVFLLSTNC